MNFIEKSITCRLCNNHMFNMKNMFLQPDIGYELSLVDSIEAFFSIKILNGDKYSKMICANCVSVIQLIHIHRRKFREKQKILIPLLKLKVEEDDEPPVLEPYYIEDTVASTTSQDSTSACVVNGKSNQCGFVRVPLEFFDHSNCPKVIISYEEKKIADNMMHGESKRHARRRKNRRKFVYLYYNDNRPGAIRELIQDKAREELYLSHLEEENRLKSVYEYSFNLKPEERDLWKIDAQLSVLVCKFCNEVFYSKQKFDAHQIVHEKFKMRMGLFEMIL